jgi:hypothetical protein
LSFIRSILFALSWRRLAAVLALSFAMPIVDRLTQGTPLSAVRAILFALSAISCLVIILGAAEAAGRGARLRYVNTLGILILILSNFLWAAVALHYFPTQMSPPWVPATMRWNSIIAFGLDQSSWSVLALIVYLNRRVAERMLQAVRQVEAQRLHQESELVESRLAAAQAQVDPQILFGDLAQIRDKLQSDAPDADQQLDELIQRLRNALARTVAGSATEATES